MHSPYLSSTSFVIAPDTVPVLSFLPPFFHPKQPPFYQNRPYSSTHKNLPLYKDCVLLPFTVSVLPILPSFFRYTQPFLSPLYFPRSTASDPAAPDGAIAVRVHLITPPRRLRQLRSDVFCEPAPHPITDILALALVRICCEMEAGRVRVCWCVC